MTSVHEQVALAGRYTTDDLPAFRDAGASDNKGLPLHRWVPWIAGFSAGFVHDVIEEYLPSDPRGECLVVDPFAGVGTTLVEGLRAGSNVMGYEINAYAALAATAKLQCLDINTVAARDQVKRFLDRARSDEAIVDKLWFEQDEAGLAELVTASRPGPSTYRSRIPFFSPPVEAKFLAALRSIDSMPPSIQLLVRVALGASMVAVSNYSYEPSLSSRPGAGKPLVENASLAQLLDRKLHEMLDDLDWARIAMPPSSSRRRRDVILGSYFDSGLPESSVSLVLTSPPYMNNYHYVRNTRPQLHWLGLVSHPSHLKQYEFDNFGKYWQTVRQGPLVSLSFSLESLDAQLKQLSEMAADRGAYGGQGWANYVASYFNDCKRFVELLRYQLAYGATAVIVVGNSVIQGIEFKVDHLLAELGEMAGLVPERIVVVRTKRVGNSIVGSSVRRDDGAAPAGQLYDAAVILRKGS